MSRVLTAAAWGRLVLLVLCITCHPLISYGQTIVDNTDPGFSILSGAWSTGSFGTPWGADYRWALTTSGAASANVEWRPTLNASGWYDVDVFFVDGTNRADDAPFTVHHATGSSPIFLDQQVGGASWVSLGTFYFDAGTTGAVELANNASPSVVIADAVRFTAVGAPQPRFRAFWADAFNVGFKNASQVDEMVARAVSGNYNAILAEVLAYHDNASNAHGAYWDSSIVPKAPDISAGFDPLAYMITKAHQAGIEVHAWILPYRVSTSWPPSGNTLLQSHPEWFSVMRGDIGGGPQPVSGLYQLDPGSPEVQEYLMSIVRELANDYEVDGVHWDYIRYTQPDAGYPAHTWYDNSGLERYRRISGASGTPLSSDAAWSDFRRREVTELVRRANIEVATADNPNQPLRHTAALITWGDAPTSFSATSAWARFQNWEHWLDKGYLDAGVAMTYYDDSQFPSYYRNWVDQSILWAHDRHIVTGQAPYLNDFSNSNTQISYAQAAGVDGIVTFSYATTSSAGNDWSWYPFVSGNAFADPIVLPTMPWKDPLVASAGTAYGRVTDGATGDPVDDATVFVNGFPAGETDGNGFFVITKLSAGPNGTLGEISVSAAGFSQVVRPDVLIERAGYTEANFGMGSWWFGDYDADGDVDADDWLKFERMWTGPGLGPPPAGGDVFDDDEDLDVDLHDFSLFQATFGS
ncbi:MAG: family 10 glycosylhydrolase, partial [Phycisphaerales bacterium]|nr:family 10 glycosylhydrolase [Phycisphaerales bacterium]